MALTVRDIMDADPVTVTPADDVETVVRLLRRHELPGLPVVNEGGRCVGRGAGGRHVAAGGGPPGRILAEADLVIADEEGDLHLPHYIELCGGVVFLEPLRRFEDRLKKAFASTVADLMTEDPVTIEPDASVVAAGRLIAHRGHNRLPLVEHGRLVGVVTRVDVLEALTRDEASAPDAA